MYKRQLFDRGIVAPGVDGGYVDSDSAFGGKAFPCLLYTSDVYKRQVLARLEPEQVAQMDALRGALMDAILAENAARNIDPKGETNHDKDL